MIFKAEGYLKMVGNFQCNKIVLVVSGVKSGVKSGVEYCL